MRWGIGVFLAFVTRAAAAVHVGVFAAPTGTATRAVSIAVTGLEAGRLVRADAARSGRHGSEQVASFMAGSPPR